MLAKKSKKQKTRNAALISLGLGVLAKEAIEKEVKAFARRHRLSKARGKKLAKEFLHEAHTAGKLLEAKMKKLHKEYEKKAMAEVESVSRKAAKKVKSRLKTKGVVVRTTRVTAAPKTRAARPPKKTSRGKRK